MTSEVKIWASWRYNWSQLQNVQRASSPQYQVLLTSTACESVYEKKKKKEILRNSSGKQVNAPQEQHCAHHGS